eukprot:3146889-Pyramimonas_sp.AAC.1
MQSLPCLQILPLLTWWRSAGMRSWGCSAEVLAFGAGLALAPASAFALALQPQARRARALAGVALDA